jgi:hypothetical protein
MTQFVVDSANARYCSVRRQLTSVKLPKNAEDLGIKIRVLSFVLYWGKTWALTLSEECNLQVFGNKVFSMKDVGTLGSF